MAAARRGRWQPPPAPSPRILNFPRRSRLTPRGARPAGPPRSPPRRNLKSLLDQERAAVFGGEAERRGRVAAPEWPGDTVEERWRVEAEILRAECNFLRMEREVALQKLAKNRHRMEAAMRSAMGTLISGRMKVDGDVEEDAEMVELMERLDSLQMAGRTGRRRRQWGKCVDDRKNFDRQASVLRRKLDKMTTTAPATNASDEEAASVREIREIDETEVARQLPDVEMLRRKMEGVSRGMVERMEEYGLLLCSSTASAASASKKKGRRAMEERPHNQQQERQVVDMDGRCCNCKEVVGWIVEQVRAESEQWNEMQAMLDHLRVEMEELQTSRDLWQHRATTLDFNQQSLHHEMLGWRRRALDSEHKVGELQGKILQLQSELQSPSSSSKTEKIKGLLQRSLDANREKEKHVLVCRVKKQAIFPKRSPLQDIGNSSFFRA